jgi:hypothetical protein
MGTFGLGEIVFQWQASESYFERFFLVERQFEAPKQIEKFFFCVGA